MYGPDVWDCIIDRISDGDTLRAICRDHGMPSPATVYNRRDDDADFRRRFARARDLGYDAIAEHLRATARGSGDSSGDVQRDKLIIDTDLKLLAKWCNKYSDRLSHEHSGPDGGPIESITRLEIVAPDLEMPSEEE